MATNPISVKEPTPNTQQEWFDYFIQKVTDTMRLHPEKSESEKVTEEICTWFNSQIDRSYTLTPVAQQKFKKAFAQAMIALDYLGRITSNKVNILKMAIHSVSDKIYIWAEINDEDKKTDHDLIEIEEKINADYYAKANMTIQTMIVQKRDNLAIPGHYYQVL